MGERPIDPEAFDLADRNRRIAAIRQRQPVRSSSNGRGGTNRRKRKSR
jgi:hypothetical protein